MKFTVRWNNIKAEHPNDIIIIHEDEDCCLLNEDAEWMESRPIKIEGYKFTFISIQGNIQPQFRFPAQFLGRAIDLAHTADRSVSVIQVSSDLIVTYRIKPGGSSHDKNGTTETGANHTPTQRDG